MAQRGQSIQAVELLSFGLSTPILQATRCTGTPRLSGGQRLGKGLRPAWPDTLVGLRGDRHWASPEVMPGIEAHATLR